jgi:hypothetical protein
VLPDGEEGELVLTTLGKQAMPMIRYRTRDITALTSRSPASAAARCGASSASAAAATTCSSSAASTSSRRRSRPPCWKVEGTLPHYQIVLTREKDLDVMEVQVEVTPEVFSDKVGALEQARRSIEHVSACASSALVEPRTIQRSEGKAKRVIDKRGCSHEDPTALALSREQAGPHHRALPPAARAGIDIRALSLADTQRFGILRMIVSDWQKRASARCWSRPATWSRSPRWWPWK